MDEAPAWLAVRNPDRTEASPSRMEDNEMSQTPARFARSKGPYGPEIARKICAQIAEGHSLTSICAVAGMPAISTVYQWRRSRPPFAAAYGKAQTAAGGPKRGGRPTNYCEAVALALCVRLGEGQAMHRLCSMPGMPALGTVHLWLKRHPEFAAMVASAREIQAQRLYDEVREIADAATPATLQVDRTRIAARQWQAGRLAPKKVAEADTEAMGGFNVRIVRFADYDDDAAGDPAAE